MTFAVRPAASGRNAFVSSQERPILIVGGGIAGVAAALALARIGIRTHVLEQAAEFKEVGAGIQLGPNAFAMFDALGVTDQINEVAAFPEHLVVHDSISGEELLCMPAGDAFRKRFGHTYGLAHRADLHSVFLDACRRTPLVTLESSQKVIDFADRGDRVTVQLRDGSARQGEALIAADGLWSTVRERLVGDGAPRVSGHIAYRAVLPAADVPDANRRNAMVLWAGEKTHLVHYPLRRGELFNVVAVFHSDRYEEGWDTYGEPAELHERFSATCADVRAMLAKIKSWRMWVLCDREPIRDWCRGRITLLGDAAHPMLQYLAQGACMAIEDAVCLARQIEAMPDDLPGAFVAYQKARYLRTARVQLTARLYGAVYHAEGATRDLRNEFIKSRTPAQSMESMAWMYEGI
jgi:3-hydroxybenzoate 6-monooxygenase